MIKRIVILQDEQLVVREMKRTGRPLALATAGAGSGLGTSLPVGPDDADEPDADLVEEEEARLDEQPAATPSGSRLADISKAAAMKAERVLIEDTLEQVHWNRRRAAELLGVSYKTLLNKIKECGISRT
jgi:DNA-binding NtrC family response regulator